MTTATRRHRLLALAEAELLTDQITDLTEDLRRAPARARGPLHKQLAEATTAWHAAHATLEGDPDE